MSVKYAVVDLETTGNAHYKGDKIIQLSAVTILDGEIAGQYTTFVDPGVPIPLFIEELTGITDEMVGGAPSFSEIAPKMLELLEDAVFVAHNVSFDLGFLESEMKAAGFPLPELDTVDTVEFAKILIPQSPSFKLSELSETLDLTHVNPHQADSDALVTAELLQLLIDRADRLPMVTLEKLSELAIHMKSDIHLIFEELLKVKRKKLDKLPAHLEVYRGIALRAKEESGGALSEKTDAAYPATAEGKDALFSSLAEYRHRDGQLKLMDTVYEAFGTNRHALIEAGTGIGKSFGYLLPAVYYAVSNGEPVVVSTYTIQMQEQLMNNEVEKLKALLPFSFRASILKGRSNYLSLLKFEQALKDFEPNYDSVLASMQLLVWLLDTETGDMDELNFSGGGHLFRQRMKHDGSFAAKVKDPWKTRDFYTHARKRALSSDIVITNHAMLLRDMESEDQLLPAYRHAVIDEAHQLQAAAQKGLGRKLEYSSVKYLIGRLGTNEKRQLLFRLEQILSARDLKPEPSFFELENIVHDLETDMDELFMQISKVFIDRQPSSGFKQQKQQVRVTGTIRGSRPWSAILMCAERVLSSQRAIASAVGERLRLIKDDVEKMTMAELALLEEVQGFGKDWELLGEGLEKFLLKPEPDAVIWLEGDARMLPNTLQLHSRPVSPAEKLSDGFFRQKASVVLTSATLTVGGSFDYMVQELGLEGFPLIREKIDSPYDYKHMARLMIPSDMPDIKAAAGDEYIEAIANHIVALADAAEGRMLVLFTSYDMLRKTHSLLKESGSLDEYVLLAQGITGGSRARLTKSFQQFSKAVLFGTNSFWEGVDVPGKDLSLLVMVRLPFSPPDEPAAQAKSEALKKIGKNAFREYSLPEAVIRFKQGFGRLIRSEQDRGIIVVLDRRIDTTTYGKYFLRSIPDIPVDRGPLNKLAGLIEKWL